MLPIRRASARIESERSRPNRDLDEDMGKFASCGLLGVLGDGLESLGDAVSAAQRRGDQLQHVGQLIGERGLTLRLCPAHVEPTTARQSEMATNRPRSVARRAAGRPSPATNATNADHGDELCRLHRDVGDRQGRRRDRRVAVPFEGSLRWPTRCGSRSRTCCCGLAVPSRALITRSRGNSSHPSRSSPTKTPAAPSDQPDRRHEASGRRREADQRHGGGRGDGASVVATIVEVVEVRRGGRRRWRGRRGCRLDHLDEQAGDACESRRDRGWIVGRT